MPVGALIWALLALPIAAGLALTLWPAARLSTIEALFDWPGFWPALWLSVGTGVASTLIVLVLTLLITAMLPQTRLFGLIERALSPLLALPHAAAALGLAFLIAPSGWVARALSPWATGWQVPPDLLVLNDPWGVALTFGLVAKELPFLLLMALAALPQCDAARRQMVAASLGYGRLAGFALTVAPALYTHLRLPLAAVLAYGMTNVDMALILGPSRPYPLSVQALRWMTDPALATRDLAAAAAGCQLALVLAVLALARLAERVGARALPALAASGLRLPRADAPARLLAAGAGLGNAALLSLSIIALAVWSVAGQWQFPDALPATWTGRAWSATGLAQAALTTALIGGASTLLALALTLLWFEEAHRRHRPAGQALGLMYLPLILPQIAFVPGLARLALPLGLADSMGAVIAVHVVFVLPYVALALSGAYRNWDRRVDLAAAALGTPPAGIFWRIRLPMLLAPVLAAMAVGLAVSVAQYLPTLIIGGGRIETLTTEAVALSSGGNRRLIGAYGLLQMALPMAGFALALVLPRLIWANRRGLRGGL